MCPSASCSPLSGSGTLGKGSTLSEGKDNEIGLQPAPVMASQVDQPHQRRAPEHAQLQRAEHLSQPAYTKGKVSRPMVQRQAGTGVYYRVTIVAESAEQMQVFFPAFDEDEAPCYEWVWRTSDRIHRATNGKWVYAGRGAWKFNCKNRKKRRTKVDAKDEPCVHGDSRGRSQEPSASDCSNATATMGSAQGSAESNAIALWFESHIRSRRAAAAAQDGDKVSWGPALSTSVRSQLGSSLDVQTNPSFSGGTGATSALQPDSAERCQLAVADSALPCLDAAATPRAGQLAATSTDKLLSADTPAFKGKLTHEQEGAPGWNGSRGSSSTLEGTAGVEC